MHKFYTKYFSKGLEEISLARALKMDKLELKYMIICGLASMGHGFLNATYNFLLADALEVRHIFAARVRSKTGGYVSTGVCLSTGGCTPWSLVPGPFWWYPLVSGP